MALGAASEDSTQSEIRTTGRSEDVRDLSLKSSEQLGAIFRNVCLMARGQIRELWDPINNKPVELEKYIWKAGDYAIGIKSEYLPPSFQVKALFFRLPVTGLTSFGSLINSPGDPIAELAKVNFKKLGPA